MNERKLTPEQIDNLFELCEFHNVYYYDVQIELVDHLASAIEAIWKTNPELSFEEAVFQVCEQFGVEPFYHAASDSLLPPISEKRFNGESGFVAIKEAKEKELRRKYDRLQWKYICEFFKLPKIILTLAITFALFLIFKFSNNDIIVSYVVQGFFTTFLAVYLIFIYPKRFRINTIPGKSFLLHSHLKSMRLATISFGFSSYNLLSFICRLTHLKFNPPFSDYFNLELFTSFLITLFGIMTVAICVYTPQRIKEDFTHEFPQFVKS